MILQPSDYYRISMLASQAAVEISDKLSGREINYKSIKELSGEIDRARSSLTTLTASRSFSIWELHVFYKSITGIDLNEIIGVRKTREEMEKEVREQEQKTGYYCSIDSPSMVKNLEAYLALKTTELNSIDSLPKERLKDMVNFCIALSHNSHAEQL